jgi:hypothetical protein
MLNSWVLSSLRHNGAVIYVNMRTGEVALEDGGHLIQLPAQTECEIASRAAEEFPSQLSANRVPTSIHRNPMHRVK